MSLNSDKSEKCGNLTPAVESDIKKTKKGFFLQFISYLLTIFIIAFVTDGQSKDAVNLWMLIIGGLVVQPWSWVNKDSNKISYICAYLLSLTHLVIWLGELFGWNMFILIFK